MTLRPPLSSASLQSSSHDEPSGAARPAPAALREKIGICQWFHFQDHAAVDRSVELLHELNVRHLRTGISWADWFRPGGEAWYRWQMDRLRQAGLEVLLSVWHTPPSLAETAACNAPPRRLLDYADFIDRVIGEYGECFSHLELWNEPNNRLKWDFPNHDPQWRKFAEMIGAAAYWARQRSRATVLGGMIPVDPHWLTLMRDGGVLDYIDVVGIHGFPGMWFPEHPNWDWHGDWSGWNERFERLRPVIGDKPIWVTETGLATWDLALQREAKYELQCEAIDEILAASGERFYLYCLIDLDPQREAIEGFHVDENEYHLGLVKFDGYRKHAFDRLRDLLRG